MELEGAIEAEVVGLELRLVGQEMEEPPVLKIF